MTELSPKKRKAEFVTPPNLLKLKAGTGGLPASVIERAQKIIEDQPSDDFIGMGLRYLAAFQEGIHLCATRADSLDTETLVSTLIHPAMQLKANGGMFGFKLVTHLSTRLILVLELVEDINPDVIELMEGFHTVLRAIISGNFAGDGGQTGQELAAALNTAVDRYLSKYNLTI